MNRSKKHKRIYMKRLTFIILLFLFINNSFSQNEKSKYSFDLYFQPNSDFLIIRPNNPNFIEPLSYKFGVDLGFIINYSISDRFQASTGLTYINRGDLMVIKKSQIVFLGSDNPFMGFEENKNWSNYNYFSIPFKIGYLMVSVKNIEISPFIGFGVDYLFNIKSTSKTIFDTVTNNKSVNIPIDNSELNRLSLSGFIGIDFLYQIKNKLILFVSPNYDMMLTPLQKDTNSPLFKTYFWNVGCRFGIRKLI